MQIFIYKEEIISSLLDNGDIHCKEEVVSFLLDNGHWVMTQGKSSVALLGVVKALYHPMFHYEVLLFSSKEWINVKSRLNILFPRLMNYCIIYMSPIFLQHKHEVPLSIIRQGRRYFSVKGLHTMNSLSWPSYQQMYNFQLADLFDVLVFFNVILAHSKSKVEHEVHLKKVMEILRE